jgi:hypothetical protein
MSDDGNNVVTITDDQLSRLVSRHNNDESETIRHLLTENKNYRDQRKDLKDRIKELESKVPSEDSVVLTKEDAQELATYRELGKVDDIKEVAGKVESLQGELSKRDRHDTFKQSAQLAGYKEAVLVDLAESKGLSVEIRDVEVDGERQKYPFAKFNNDENGELKPLNELIESSLGDYLPSLVIEDKSGPNSPKVPRQGPSGGKPLEKVSGFEAVGMEKRYPRPSERTSK